ncbi:MAG: hypothetical protein J7485_12955 [Sphingobium sp.]|nr:hypothetical protein [Sphingobium sp.]
MTADAAMGWNRWRIARWAAAGVLLTIPAIMMQISDEWNWRPESFVMFGTVIGSLLLIYEFAARRSASATYRIGTALALVASFLLVWINLAVGIVGEDNPVNLSFFGIVITAIVSVFAARARADGLWRAMLGVGLTQLLLGVVIATAPSTALAPRGALGVLVLSGFFGAIWLISAACFWSASRSEQS